MNGDMWTTLRKKNIPVVLYGTGNGADKIAEELRSRGVAVAGVFASSGFVRERTFRGFRVMPYEECKRLFPDSPVLMCFGSSRPEVLKNAEHLMAENDFYVPDVPVYGSALFDAPFYEAHTAELQSVRARLADELSVKTFDNVISFKLSGKPRYLFECETSEYEADGIIKLGENAVIADFGAYNGDTVQKYAALYPRYARIVAVEPDKRNFRKLGENTAELRNVTCVNALVSDAVGESLVDGAGGRGVHEAEKGAGIRSVTVDELFGDTGADFLKFDVEGNELAALRGAARTIKKYRPAMLVSCYHRSEDLFSLPEEIMSVREDYKIYLRKLPGLPAWDMQYYFT